MPSALQLPVPDDPTVSFRLWFRGGSSDDPPGKEGLACLTGLMVGEAATERNPYRAILEKLYPMASAYGLRVDREMSCLAGRTHRDNLEPYLELFHDAWLRPAFDEADFERHRSDLINGIENGLRYASDEELAKASLYEWIFEGTSYRHPAVGTVSGLRAIEMEDVRSFHARHYLRRESLPALGGGYPADRASRRPSRGSRPARIALRSRCPPP